MPGMCYRDAQGRYYCDHVHAEMLPANGGGFHEERTRASADEEWGYCWGCDTRIPMDMFEDHTREHFRN